MAASTPYEHTIRSMTSLFDQMDGATIDAWSGLTGLQIQLVRVVAAHERIDRASLATWALTSRGAIVPSLSGLLQRGVLMEIDDGGPRLMIGPAGQQLLDAVLSARSAWLRGVAEHANPPVSTEELTRTAALLNRITGSA